MPTAHAIMLAILVTLAWATTSAAPVQSALPDVQEIQRLEAVWNEAHLGGNVAALDALCATDLTVIVPGMNPMSKADILGFWKSGRAKITQYQTTDVKVAVRGRTAVVTGRLARTRDFNGTAVNDRWQFTKVYAHDDGGWVLVAYHASEAPK